MAENGNSGHAAEGTLTVESHSEEISDNDLVAGVLAGDETAFEALFHRYRFQAGRVAGRFFQQPEQVEEIIQESFTKIYFGLKDYVGRNEKSFVAWLMRIVVNACYDELRRAKRKPEVVRSGLSDGDSDWLESRLADETADVEALAISRDLAGKLLSRLSPEDRLVLTLLNGEELSVAETAAITGWSPAKVKVRAHRARLALRKVLKRLL